MEGSTLRALRRVARSELAPVRCLVEFRGGQIQPSSLAVNREVLPHGHRVCSQHRLSLGQSGRSLVHRARTLLREELLTVHALQMRK